MASATTWSILYGVQLRYHIDFYHLVLNPGGVQSGARLFSWFDETWRNSTQNREAGPKIAFPTSIFVTFQVLDSAIIA